MPGCGSMSVPTPMRRRIARKGRARSWRNAPRSGKAAEPDVARRPRKQVPPITEGNMDSKTAGLREALQPLFGPAHVAVIGASSTPGKQGNTAIRYLERCGFPGRISPVNPAGGEVEGLTCYRSIKEVPGP